MPTLSLPPVSPGWPVETAASGRRLRRLVGVSLLAHGLALSLKFQFWPFFPADRSIQPISVRLAPPQRPAEATRNAPPETQPLAAGQPSRPAARLAGLTETAPLPSENAVPRLDHQAMIERGKADLDADSRRQMLDPMFAAPVRRPAAASPLERATAGRTQTVEQLAGQHVRVTTADGRQYCLQSPPEAATRDIPTPVVAVPSNCP